MTLEWQQRLSLFLLLVTVKYSSAVAYLNKGNLVKPVYVAVK